MKHAEICPVCNGTGLYKEYLKEQTTIGPISIKTCHGCNGKGWVTIDDTTPFIPNYYGGNSNNTYMTNYTKCD